MVDLQQPLHPVLRLQAIHLCIHLHLDLQATIHHQVIQCHLVDTLERPLDTGHILRHKDIRHILTAIRLLQSLATDRHLMVLMRPPCHRTLAEIRVRQWLVR